MLPNVLLVIQVPSFLVLPVCNNVQLANMEILLHSYVKIALLTVSNVMDRQILPVQPATLINIYKSTEVVQSIFANKILFITMFLPWIQTLKLLIISNVFQVVIQNLAMA